MQINLIGCFFVLNSEKNSNIRKNDIKSIKVLVDRNRLLPEVLFSGGDMKSILREYLQNIIGSNIFHLEQVFTESYENSMDVIYLGITNMEYVSKLSENYQLIDFKIESNERITYGNDTILYKTIEVEENNNIEYIHEIECSNLTLKRNLFHLLISYKKIRSSMDNTDIMFKFMGRIFTLEDVRQLYELVKDTSVDKSNFRKKIIKYCEKIEDNEQSKNGFRPSQKYKFKPLKGDVWL